jgi:HAE1 family hydrophobic/amphiphilic exporter-1
MEAALKGSGEIGFTIISITFSLVAVFLPVLFMGGIVGRLFREFAVTISVAILLSGFISLTLTPMLCSRWLKPHKGAAGDSDGHDKESALAQRLEAGFDAIHRLYERSLDWVLRHQRLTLISVLASLLATILAFNAMPKGFFPLEDTGFVFAITEAAQDISYDAMVEKQKQAAAIIGQDPAVQNVFFAFGGGRGALNSGRIFFGLTPPGERPPAGAVIQRLRSQLSQVQGLNVFMQPIQNIQIGGRLSQGVVPIHPAGQRFAGAVQQGRSIAGGDGQNTWVFGCQHRFAAEKPGSPPGGGSAKGGQPGSKLSRYSPGAVRRLWHGAGRDALHAIQRLSGGVGNKGRRPTNA